MISPVVKQNIFSEGRTEIFCVHSTVGLELNLARLVAVMVSYMVTNRTPHMPHWITVSTLRGMGPSKSVALDA